MCVYVYIYMYMYIYIYIYTYIYVYMQGGYTYIHIYVYILHMYIYMCIYAGGLTQNGRYRRSPRNTCSPRFRQCMLYPSAVPPLQEKKKSIW